MSALQEQILAKVVQDGDCWRWTGTRSDNGYGQIRVAGRSVGVHRVAHEMFIGPIPDGLHIDHLCRVRDCVNPAHLEAVTQGENNRRAAPYRTPPPLATECGRGHSMADAYVFVSGGKVRRTCRQCDGRRSRKARERAAGRPLLTPAAERTHCPNGHPYDDTNTSVRSTTGHRRCRACHRVAERQRRARQAHLLGEA